MLADPHEEPHVWSIAPRVRSWFAQHATDTRFVARTTDGLRLWVSLRDHVESQIFWHDMQEGDRGLVRWLRSYLLPGMVVADVGAYCGYFTLLSASRVGHAGHVLAFEPQAEVHARLLRNVALNAFDNVTTFRRGLSDAPGSGVLWKPQGNNPGMATLHREPGAARSETAASETVAIERFDDMVPGTAAAHRLDVMKIDVEGHELAVLRGAEECLRRHRPAVACEYLSGDTRVLRFMRKLGYHSYWIESDGETRLFDDEATTPLTQNVLFLPEGSAS